ncbi:AMP-binding protein [Deinococcus yavapaiensis]|uniref:Acetyl-CoA synthetase n=1 Tax=Deinococcus yavapaiensis KR-236 TaxID=694435 RepID=A0A318S490_9DEIO|nr:AMP-binding protein [Deinococcus yavapaiensis]PYE49962.1 acetyl-CoA synthetase [Deinococcus yavapaiensis KR-236]
MNTSSPFASTATDRFRAARDLLVKHRADLEAARAAFEWPRFEHFNFALDWFDSVARTPETADRLALVVTEQDGRSERRTYAQLSRASSRVANWLESIGVRREDRVLVMLGNRVELWEVMLACIKIGAVLIPTTVLLTPADLADRVRRGRVSCVVVAREDAAKFDAVDGDFTVVLIGAEPAFVGSRAVHAYEDARNASDAYTPREPTRGDETLLLYFTSGTTSRPKLVEHTHTSYPVGHLSTMYWIGLEPGDVHLNVASPGWAKHAWSNFFAPFIAEATVFVYNYARFDARSLMEQMDREGVTSFCAPPTVWRMLIQADLSALREPPAKVVAAGEPLNPEVISQVQRAWGVLIRDGFGQTETTLQVGNTVGQAMIPGSMGRPLPGFDVVLIDPLTGMEGEEGEVCLRLDSRPVGLTVGYHGDSEKTADAFRDGLYHTGDVARRLEGGVITYIGRSDDVFKSSDYRISPFELESVLIEHAAVAEAAVVPSFDAVRLAVPKAYVVLAAGWNADAETAESILAHCRAHLAPFKRVRRLEFHDLPKTISGKIRRVELRQREQTFTNDRPSGEYADADFPSLRAP